MGIRFQEVPTLLYRLPLVLIHGLGQVQEQRQEAPLYRDVRAYYKLDQSVLFRKVCLDKVRQPGQKELLQQRDHVKRKHRSYVAFVLARRVIPVQLPELRHLTLK